MTYNIIRGAAAAVYGGPGSGGGRLRGHHLKLLVQNTGSEAQAQPNAKTSHAWPEPVAKVQPMLASDSLALAVKRLGLSKTLLAQIFNVSRQTIYDWLDDKHLPEPQHQVKLALLEELCADPELEAHPLNRRWSKHPAHQGRSLFEVLNQAAPTSAEVKEVLSALKAEAAQWRARQEEAPVQADARDALEREVNLLINLSPKQERPNDDD